MMPWLLGVVSLMFHELSKIISRKCTMPEMTFMVRISSWNCVRVPKAWSTNSAIHKFRENILESLWNISETTPWTSFQYKDCLFRCRDSHYLDETVFVRPSYLYNGNPYARNMLSSYWNGCHVGSRYEINCLVQIKFLYWSWIKTLVSCHYDDNK